MVMDFGILSLIFFVGILSRIADMISDDGLKVRKPLDHITGIVYGSLIAYVIVFYPAIAPLGIAVVTAVIIMGKIDSAPHNLAIASMILLLAYWGLPEVNLMIAAVFLIAGISDEIGNDLADNGRIKGIKAKVLGKRYILEASAISISLATGEWMFFAALLSFDVGHVLTEKIVMKIRKRVK